MQKNSQGFLTLEVIVALAIIVISFGVFLEIGTSSIKNSTSLRETVDVTFLAKEALEITRSFRNSTEWATNGLGVLSTGSSNPYHFDLNISQSPTTWVLTPGEETIGIYTRKIIFDQVSRDPLSSPAYNIETTYNPSHDDPNTKKITALISWSGKTFKLVTYLTNW